MLTLGMELRSDMVSQWSDMLPALQAFWEAQHLSREAGGSRGGFQFRKSVQQKAFNAWSALMGAASLKEYKIL